VTDLHIDHAGARSSLQDAAGRTALLFGSIADAAVSVRRSTWSVADVGAHLAVALQIFTESVTDDYHTVGPHIPATGTFAERLSAVTAGTLTAEPERDPKALSQLICQRVEEFLVATADLSGETAVATPWYGDGVTLSVATATAMLVGEQLLHGFDVATTIRRPWTISVPDAHLILRGITSMMPLGVNPATTAALRASYEVNVRRGGPRFVVRVDDATARVEAAGSGPVDCHLSADPVALVLVGYGRTSQWGPIAHGKLLTWGRKPWLAFRFTNLFFNP